MTVSELIEELKDMPQEIEVHALVQFEEMTSGWACKSIITVPVRLVEKREFKSGRAICHVFGVNDDDD